MGPHLWKSTRKEGGLCDGPIGRPRLSTKDGISNLDEQRHPFGAALVSRFRDTTVRDTTVRDTTVRDTTVRDTYVRDAMFEILLTTGSNEHIVRASHPATGT
jgi:hypothetical protein